MNVTLIGHNLNFVELSGEMHAREYRFTLCSKGEPVLVKKGDDGSIVYLDEDEKPVKKIEGRALNVSALPAQTFRTINTSRLCPGCVATLKLYGSRYVRFDDD